MLQFRRDMGRARALFEHVIEQTLGVSEGVRIGTLFKLNFERDSRERTGRMRESGHPHLVLWAEKDGWIAPEGLKRMTAAMAGCRLVILPGVGARRCRREHGAVRRHDRSGELTRATPGATPTPRCIRDPRAPLRCRE